ncbi:MAG: DUF5317 domain-containing protein [Acidimicrobiales bacterium]
MIIAEVCIVVIAIEALILRKRLVQLTKLRIRRLWLVWLALLDQIVVISVLPDHPHFLLSIANFGSYLAAGVFVWSNRRIPGALVIGLGGACNVTAIALNGGKMPASKTALEASGWKPLPGHFVNSGVVSHPKLAFLGDIFNTPRWLPGHTVFSIGDVIAVVGIALLVYLTCAKAPRTPATAPTAADVEQAESPAVRDAAVS